MLEDEVSCQFSWLGTAEKRSVRNLIIISFLRNINGEITSASKNIITRIPLPILDRVPNAAEILLMSLEDLQRKDGEDIAARLSDVCNAAISTNSMKPTFLPDREQIHIYFVTKNGEIPIPFNQSEQLIDFSNFEQDENFVILISGWNSNTSNTISSKLKEAYHCRGKVNLVVIDFGHHIHNLQTWLSLNNEQIGQWIGEVVSEFAKNVSISRIHLIGLGIGAHVAGAAARKFTSITGRSLPRVTALDPAMLCYKESQTLTGLQKGDAAFVDVIHTSAYGLGKPEPIGDVDFFPNGPSTLQPGCNNLVCAHNQAVEYFAETVMPGKEDNFLGQKCNSIKNLNSNVCQQKYIVMGFATPNDAKGNYFLRTKDESPYGNNLNSSVGSVQCRVF